MAEVQKNTKLIKVKIYSTFNYVNQDAKMEKSGNYRPGPVCRNSGGGQYAFRGQINKELSTFLSSLNF